MSEEEAIKILKNETDYLCEDKDKAIENVLNLIKKQQKEIEFYRNNNYILENQNGEVVAMKYCPENYISKDKIREKIKELEEMRDENADEIKRNLRFYSIYDSYNLQISELQELLEEG